MDIEKWRGDTRLLAAHVGVTLREAKAKLDSLQGGEKAVLPGATFGDFTSDTDIRADVVIGDFLAARFARFKGVGRITCEGHSETETVDTGPLQVFVDQLDGSLNYRSRGNTVGLPFSACVTVVDQRPATFADIIAASVLDLRFGDLWSAWKSGDTYGASVNNAVARTNPEARLDIGANIVIGEMYHPENRERLARAFAETKGCRFRNLGSAAYEMALVASGTAVAFICDRQKQAELGAGYALMRGSGGVAVDFEGNDLGGRKYDFASQTTVILAANARIAEQIIHRLRRM